MTLLQLSWTIIFAIALLLFTIVEIVVVIGGAKNLLHMMKALLKNKDN